ncbi:hypothetical protein D9M71_823260 [compost metagenome]
MLLAGEGHRLAGTHVELTPVHRAGDQAVLQVAFGQGRGGVSAQVGGGVVLTFEVVDADVAHFGVGHLLQRARGQLVTLAEKNSSRHCALSWGISCRKPRPVTQAGTAS